MSRVWIAEMIPECAEDGVHLLEGGGAAQQHAPDAEDDRGEDCGNDGDEDGERNRRGVGRARDALLDAGVHLVADLHAERFDHADLLVQQDLLHDRRGKEQPLGCPDDADGDDERSERPRSRDDGRIGRPRREETPSRRAITFGPLGVATGAATAASAICVLQARSAQNADRAHYLTNRLNAGSPFVTPGGHRCRGNQGHPDVQTPATPRTSAPAVPTGRPGRFPARPPTRP